MKRLVNELKSAKIVNEYGVTIVNRLVELKYPRTGRIDEYVWYQDMIQPDGSKFTSCFCHYKKFAYMEKAMKQYNFNFKEA